MDPDRQTARKTDRQTDRQAEKEPLFKHDDNKSYAAYGVVHSIAQNSFVSCEILKFIIELCNNKVTIIVDVKINNLETI